MSESSSQPSKYTTSFQLAPGETDVAGDRFTPSLMTPYLKGELMCSSTRFVYRMPKTLFGLIPVGHQENTVPIRNIASVSSSNTVKPIRLLLGLILAIVGLLNVANGSVGSIVAILIGVPILLTSFPATLRVANPAGGADELTISALERGRLDTFTKALQARIFADQSAIQHNEAQSIRTMQLQQQQIANMLAQQNHQNHQNQQNPQNPPQPPQA